MIAGALVFSVIVSQGWSGRIVCGIIEKGGSATSGTAGECKRGGDLALLGGRGAAPKWRHTHTVPVSHLYGRRFEPRPVSNHGILSYTERRSLGVTHTGSNHGRRLVATGRRHFFCQSGSIILEKKDHYFGNSVDLISIIFR